MPRMRIDAYHIDPVTAEAWLKNHAPNRPLSERWVKTLSEEILSGRWLPNHQAINIDESGNLTDGQHRLWAIVRSKKSVPCVVSYCEDNKPYGIDELTPYRGMFSNLYVDRGRVRTARDSVNIMFASANRRTIGQYEGGAYGTILKHVLSYYGNHTIHSLQELADRFGDDYDALHHNLSSHKTGMRKGAVVAGFLLCRKLDPNKVDEAARLFRDGHGMDMDHPMFRLRESVIGYTNSTHSSDRAVLLRTCNAVCHHIEGRRCRFLKCSPSSLIRAGKAHGWDLSTLSWLEDYKAKNKETNL